MTPNAATKAKFRAIRLGCHDRRWQDLWLPGRGRSRQPDLQQGSVAQPPKTFQEIAKIGEDLKKNGKRAIMWAYDTYFSYPWWLPTVVMPSKTATGYDVKDTGVNNAVPKASVGYISEMIKSGHLEGHRLRCDGRQVQQGQKWP